MMSHLSPSIVSGDIDPTTLLNPEDEQVEVTDFGHLYIFWRDEQGRLRMPRGVYLANSPEGQRILAEIADWTARRLNTITIYTKVVN